MIRLPNLNLAILAGRLTADPSLNYSSNSTPVSNFTIAVNKTYKDKEGDWKSKVSFINITAWGKLAEITAEYLRKGNPVLIQGTIQSRKGKDDEGNNQNSLAVIAKKVQFLEKQENDSSDESNEVEESAKEDGDGGENDDLPF